MGSLFSPAPSLSTAELGADRIPDTMHIPQSMIEGAVCPVTAAVAVGGLAASAWCATRSESRPGAARFAAVTSLIFAAQMVNFPIQMGTSGHLLGGVLAAVLLGTPFGVLAIALVLSVQCLVFSDGGLAVLGANILNMAVIGAGVGGLMAGKWRGVSAGSLSRVAFAAWASLLLAALACAVELALAGRIPLQESLPTMLGVHALIGLAEAGLTALAVVLLPSANVRGRRSVLVPAVSALGIALVLSPFASGSPDGLEWAAQKLGFLHESAPAFLSPLNGYAVAGIPSEGLATSLAGLAGVILVFALGMATARLWARRPILARP